MNTVTPEAAEVKPAIIDEAGRLAADSAAYDAWLEANADQLAAEAECYAMYEEGHPTW